MTEEITRCPKCDKEICDCPSIDRGSFAKYVEKVYVLMLYDCDVVLMNVYRDRGSIVDNLRSDPCVISCEQKGDDIIVGYKYTPNKCIAHTVTYTIVEMDLL